MKNTLLLTLSCVLLLSGCRSNRSQCDIVKETYIHKYGVPVTKSDWEHQGQEGQVVSLRKDGVTLTQSFDHGLLHGETTYSFPHTNTVHTVDTFDHGALVARRTHYTSGLPKEEHRYEAGDLAQILRWYEEGTPSAIENYECDKLVSGEYRTPLNIVEARVVGGAGIRMWRSQEGGLLAQETIQNGELAERTTYFPNGDPQTIATYAGGVIHGTRLTFAPGGEPLTDESWVHGVQEGVTIVYQNGEKIAEVPYVHGKRHGIECRYREGALLVEEITWKDDTQHGVRKLFVDGSTSTEWYHQGELVSRPTFERLNLPHQ